MIISGAGGEEKVPPGAGRCGRRRQHLTISSTGHNSTYQPRVQTETKWRPSLQQQLLTQRNPS